MKKYFLLLVLVLHGVLHAQSSGYEVKGLKLGAPVSDFVTKVPGLTRFTARSDKTDKFALYTCGPAAEGPKPCGIKVSDIEVLGLEVHVLNSVVVGYIFIFYPLDNIGISKLEAITKWQDSRDLFRSALIEKFGPPLNSDDSGSLWRKSGDKVLFGRRAGELHITNEQLDKLWLSQAKSLSGVHQNETANEALSSQKASVKKLKEGLD